MILLTPGHVASGGAAARHLQAASVYTNDGFFQNQFFVSDLNVRQTEKMKLHLKVLSCQAVVV